jgi:hypothetical protein
MKLVCFALHDFAPQVVPARPHRRWMDGFLDRHPYRCLPLAIANAHGWEILCPVPIEIAWNGGKSVDDLVVRALKPLPGGRPIEHFCRSNFSHGIVTFHLDYIFRTDPGWDLLATGPFNQPKENACPLTGVIESDWLPYPFTMNWQVERPGRLVFEEDEPYCLIFPLPKHVLQDCQPEIYRLEDDPEFQRQHESFRASREEFMQRRRDGDPAVIAQAWQRHYFIGRHPDGTLAQSHINKLRLAAPVDRRVPAAPVSTLEPVKSRWGSDSLLNQFELGQTEHNETGRRRIDREGRLTTWDQTYVISSAKDAAGADFLVVDNLLAPAECDLLCQTFRDLADRVFSSDEIDPYWNNRFIWYEDIVRFRPAVARIMIEACQQGIKRITDFYSLRSPVFADLLQIVRWQEGIFMPPHADNANPDGSPHAMAHREMAGIFYLNDDYTGGELYFTALDIAVKPKRGTFVATTAGFHHEHAVLRIESGTRYTMPFFLTFDPEKADRAVRQAMAR